MSNTNTNALSFDQLVEMANKQASGVSTTKEEKFKTKFRANIVWLMPDASTEKGYKPISLPYGMALELSPDQRKGQMPLSLDFMDKLKDITSKLPEGQSVELNPQPGAITISLRHVGEPKIESNIDMHNALDKAFNM